MPCAELATEFQARSVIPSSTLAAREPGASDQHRDGSHSWNWTRTGAAHVAEVPDLEGGARGAPPIQTEVIVGHRSAVGPIAAVADEPVERGSHRDDSHPDPGVPFIVEVQDLEGGASTPPIEIEAPGGRRAITATTLETTAAEKNCGLTTRRWHQIIAVGVGLLEVAFSVYNALAEDSFKMLDPTDFVFSASAAMESVGLAVTLFAALCREISREEGQGGRGPVLETLGSPLAILVNGVRQKERSLAKVGHFGAMCQTAVVSVVGMVLLQRIDKRIFVILFYVIFLLLAGFCLAAHSRCCENWIKDVLIVSRSDSTLEPEDAAAGIMYALVMLPLGVEVAEVVLLVFGGGSWNATILALLDFAVASALLFPHGYKHFMRSCPEAAQRLTRDSWPNCPFPVFCHVDNLVRIFFP